MPKDGQQENNMVRLFNIDFINYIKIFEKCRKYIVYYIKVQNLIFNNYIQKSYLENIAKFHDFYIPNVNAGNVGY